MRRKKASTATNTSPASDEPDRRPPESDAVKRFVDMAPPFSPEDAARLREIFASARRDGGRDA